MGLLDIGHATLLGAAALLAGCQSSGERMMAQAAHRDTCGAGPLRSFVGRTADRPTRDAMEQRVPSKRRLRWIELGKDMPGDLNTGRINVLLSESGTIKAVDCY